MHTAVEREKEKKVERECVFVEWVFEVVVLEEIRKKSREKEICIVKKKRGRRYDTH